MNIHIEKELPTHISMSSNSFFLSLFLSLFPSTLFHININGLCKSLFHASGMACTPWNLKKKKESDNRVENIYARSELHVYSYDGINFIY